MPQPHSHMRAMHSELPHLRHWYRPDGSLERTEQILGQVLVRTFYRANGTLERCEELCYYKHKTIITLYDEAGESEDLADGTAAVRQFYANGGLDFENHYLSGRLRSFSDGKADIRNYYEDGTIKTEYWGCSGRERTYYPDGSLERDSSFYAGSCFVTLLYRLDGSLAKETYGSDSRLFDPPNGSPAVRAFRPDGSIEYEEHYECSGSLDDPSDGSPAVRWYHDDGTIHTEGHYRHGVPLTQHQVDDCELCGFINKTDAS